MENKFKYSNDNKRYHTWNYHLQRKFGGKVFKVALNGGFTCPNIDGKKGVGGCIYCSSSGSGDFAGDPSHNILTQFEEVKERMHKKWQYLSQPRYPVSARVQTFHATRLQVHMYLYVPENTEYT